MYRMCNTHTMTAPSNPTPAAAYLSGGPVPPYLTGGSTTTHLTMPTAGLTRVKRTPLQVVRDVLLCLASLCIVVMTAAVVALGVTVGHALSQVGTSDTTPAYPVPSYSCAPTWQNC